MWLRAGLAQSLAHRPAAMELRSGRALGAGAESGCAWAEWVCVSAVCAVLVAYLGALAVWMAIR